MGARELKNLCSSTSNLMRARKHQQFEILEHVHIIVDTNPPQYVIIYKWVGSPLGCKVLKYIAVFCYAIDCDWAGLRLVSTWYIPLCPM